MAEEFLVPPLREDLILTPAPRDNGAPCWMVQDPVSGNYLRADWTQFTVLKFLDRPQDFSALCARIRENSTLRLDDEEIRAFIRELSRQNLLRAQLFRPAETLLRERQHSRPTPGKWLLSHYLYFRIPLLHPDAFLTRTQVFFQKLVSRPAAVIYGLLLLAGIYFLCQRFSFYADLAREFLNWRGAFAFGAAIVTVKTLHEFAHAYSAKILGNHVPAMGVAFIVFWPVPYCDVSDSWRMDSRRRRLLISAAGILCELVIAAAALSLCILTENPLLRNTCFMLATAGLAGTLLVNLNPLMRFDGYYLFCDFWGIDNLYSRSTAFLLWRYRRTLGGFDAPDPEKNSAAGTRKMLALYAICAWVYRFFLYFGIAVVVYYAFPKIIGICLFALEISVFIAAPAWREARYWWRERARCRPRPAGIITAAAGLTALLWAGLPLPRHTAVPAVFAAAQTQTVYAPFPGILRAVNARNGQRVARNDPLAVIEPLELETARREARARTAALRAAWRRATATAAGRENLEKIRELREQLAGARARENGLEQQARNGVIRAEASGIISGWDNAAREGAVVAGRTRLGVLCDLGGGRAQAYLPAELADYVPAAAGARFFPADGRPPVDMTLAGFSPVREKELHNRGLPLSQGGALPTVTDSRGNTLISGSFYLLNAHTPVTADLPGNGQTGTLWFWSSGRSYLAAAGRALWRVLLRESGI